MQTIITDNVKRFFELQEQVNKQIDEQGQAESKVADELEEMGDKLSYEEIDSVIELSKSPMTKLTKELYESPMKDRNYEKHGYGGCICCYKPMKETDCLLVHMNEHWMALNPDFVTEENCFELTGANSQGWFPIGNDCAKKMKGFVFNPNK